MNETEKSRKSYDRAKLYFEVTFSSTVAVVDLRADLHDTILSHATSSRQAYDITYDCRSVLKHVLKCYDIFPDLHNNRKSCRGPVVSRCRMRQNRTV